MPDVTYTAIGHINPIAKTMNVELGIPVESEPAYDFKFYNFSTKLENNETLNVVAIQLIFGIDAFTNVSNYNYQLKINLRSIADGGDLNEDYAGRALDLDTPDTLLLFIHDDILIEENIDDIKEKIFAYYSSAKRKSSAQLNAYPLRTGSGKPRAVGISIL